MEQSSDLDIRVITKPDYDLTVDSDKVPEVGLLPPSGAYHYLEFQEIK